MTSADLADLRDCVRVLLYLTEWAERLATAAQIRHEPISGPCLALKSRIGQIADQLVDAQMRDRMTCGPSKRYLRRVS